MKIGLPREIKDNEFRVALVPSGVRELTAAGHSVVVERGAGLGSGISDDDYKSSGAECVSSPEELFASSELVIKVKEPLPSEFPLLRPGLTLFTFFHLAANRPLLDALLESRTTAVAYETIELPGHRTPVLEPMSAVAGRLSVQIGAHYLLKSSGGRGVLLGGVPGVGRGSVVIIGAGVVGQNALKISVGLGARVTVFAASTRRLGHIDELYGTRVATLVANRDSVEAAVLECDLLVGAVHLPGRRTPTVVTKEMVSAMKKGSVIVDVSVDQGGSVETIRPTTHSDPVYDVDGVLHYGVANMPGAVPRTSTAALTNATLPYLLKMAALGLAGAASEEPSLLPGVNTFAGRVTNRAVADLFALEYTPPESILER